MKSFSKNLSFGVNFKLWVPPLRYKINTDNISGVSGILTKELLQCPIMYVLSSRNQRSLVDSVLPY